MWLAALSDGDSQEVEAGRETRPRALDTFRCTCTLLRLEAFFRGALADGGPVGKDLPGDQGLVVGCLNARFGHDVEVRLLSICTVYPIQVATLPDDLRDGDGPTW